MTTQQSTHTSPDTTYHPNEQLTSIPYTDIPYTLYDIILLVEWGETFSMPPNHGLPEWQPNVPTTRLNVSLHPATSNKTIKENFNLEATLPDEIFSPIDTNFHTRNAKKGRNILFLFDSQVRFKNIH